MDINLKGYALEMRYCETCKQTKIHEICFDLKEKIDYVVCQKCGTIKKDESEKGEMVLNSMRGWNNENANSRKGK